MRHSIRTGFSFGLTSGIITTLGVIVGLHSSTHSNTLVIGGILVVAVADALSDAMGIHVAEEASGHHSEREIWEATAATFLSKLVFALTFLIPVVFLPLSTAIVVSVAWGLFLIITLSLFLARLQGLRPVSVIVEHLAITVVVIAATHYIGDWVSTLG